MDASLGAQGLRRAERAAPTPRAQRPDPGSGGSGCLLRASCGWGCREPRRALSPLPPPPPLNIHRFLPPRPADRLPSTAAHRRPPAAAPAPAGPAGRLGGGSGAPRALPGGSPPAGRGSSPALPALSAQPSHIPGTRHPGRGSAALETRARTPRPSSMAPSLGYQMLTETPAEGTARPALRRQPREGLVDLRWVAGEGLEWQWRCMNP